MARTMTPLQTFKARVKLATPLALDAFAVNGQPARHKFLGTTRLVGFVGSKQFALNSPRVSTIGSLDDVGLGMSYMDWPKASELLWLDGATVLITSHGVSLTYRFA